MASAEEFYGASYARATNPAKLADAVRWFEKAVQFEKMGAEGATKLPMALKAALKAEAEAFGHEPSLTNLAA